jgi:hypothetical protein
MKKFSLIKGGGSTGTKVCAVAAPIGAKPEKKKLHLPDCVCCAPVNE